MLFSWQIDFKISPSVWDPMFSLKILDSHDSSFHERDLSTHGASESFPHRWHDCQVAEIIWPEFSWVCGTQEVQSVQHTTALPLISGTAAAKKLPSRRFLLYLSFWGRSFYVTQKTLSSGSLSPLREVAAGVTLPIHSGTDQTSFCQHPECNTPPWQLGPENYTKRSSGNSKSCYPILHTGHWNQNSSWVFFIEAKEAHSLTLPLGIRQGTSYVHFG